MKLFSGFKKIRFPRIVRLGILILLLIALPIFVWAVATQRIELRKYASTAEPTVVCWDKVVDNGSSIPYWPDSCKGNPETEFMACTQIIVPLTSEEKTTYYEWVSLGKPFILGCGIEKPTPTPTDLCRPCEISSDTCPDGLTCQAVPQGEGGCQDDGQGHIVCYALSIKHLCAPPNNPNACKPPALTPTPSTTQAQNWTTQYALLHANDMTLTANGKVFKGAHNGTLVVHSNPNTTNPNYTTLESTWFENGIEMRIFIYFYAEPMQESNNRHWGISELRTYNGNAQGDWIYYHNTIPPVAYGTRYKASTLTLTSDTNNTIPGSIVFKDLEIQAFLNNTLTPTPTIPNLTPTPSLPCARSNPHISVTPQSQSGYPGETQMYSVTVTNNDNGTSCTAGQFTTWAQVSNGWTYSFSPPNFLLSPGQSYTTQLAVTPPNTQVAQNPPYPAYPVSVYAKSVYSDLQTRNDISFTVIPLVPLVPQTITFNVKLAGVSAGQAEEEGAKIAVKFLKKDGSIVAISDPLTLTYMSGGVYKATATLSNPFSAGTEYVVKIKGEKHVAVKFCKQSGQTGPCPDTEYITMSSPVPASITYNFTGIALPPGDLPPQDGSVVQSDLLKLITLKSKFSGDQKENDIHTADLNYDGIINGFDLFLILQTLMTRYDE